MAQRPPSKLIRVGEVQYNMNGQRGQLQKGNDMTGTSFDDSLSISLFSPSPGGARRCLHPVPRLGPTALETRATSKRL